jgi:uncharacterized protein involved in oxidation of intracellular sulfur
MRNTGEPVMRVLIILSSNDPEIRWNAIRFGNFLLNQDEEVTIFLNGAQWTIRPGTASGSPSWNRPSSSL